MKPKRRCTYVIRQQPSKSTWCRYEQYVGTGNNEVFQNKFISPNIHSIIAHVRMAKWLRLLATNP